MLEVHGGQDSQCEEIQMGYARRKDANHNEIGDYLRSRGWSVLDIWRAGSGVPDLAVGKPGFACLVEIKGEGKKLTDAERKVRDQWDGLYVLVTTPLDAERQLDALYAARSAH